MILQVRVEDCGLNFNFIWALRFLVDVKMDEKKEEEKKKMKKKVFWQDYKLLKSESIICGFNQHVDYVRKCFSLVIKIDWNLSLEESWEFLVKQSVVKKKLLCIIKFANFYIN